MINTVFEAYKVRREVKRCGTKLKFYRHALNEFGEPTDELAEVAEVNGLYHEQTSYMTVTSGDGSLTRKKKQPMLLCVAEDIANAGVKFGDIVKVPVRSPQMTSKTLKYVGCVDIQNWGIIVDLSFEEVDDGNS